MGIVIGRVDYSRIVNPVTPMPDPNTNVLTAIQSLASGNINDIATKTITRCAETVINDFTANMTEFASLVSSAISVFKTIDADKNRMVYSRFADILIRIMVNLVNKNINQMF